MHISVGIDIAKEMHWVTAIDDDGVVRLDRKLANTPTAIAGLIAELEHLGGTVRIGLDVVGIFPGLERCLDLTTKGPLALLTKFVTPAELRAAGKKRLVRHPCRSPPSPATP